MKLEVGMYCRYNGRISKISWISQQKFKGLDNTIEATFHLENDRIIKFPNDSFTASHNIIDLIKRNDIILGRDGKIYQVWKIYKDYVFTYSKNKYGQTITLVDYQIDKILTRESFENNCYKLGD